MISLTPKAAAKQLFRVWMSKIDRPMLPPTSREIQLVEELRGNFRNLPEAIPAGPSEIAKSWTEHLRRLRHLVLNEDPREFLRWEVIRYTMFLANSVCGVKEIFHLRRNNWKSRWEPAIQESSAGRPVPFYLYPKSSGNLIHHAYHLSQLEDRTGIRMERMGLLVEFGGGYGGMCRLVHNLGFKGKYLIFDLPEFSALQKYFLKSIGVPVLDSAALDSAPSGAGNVTDLEDLRRILASRGTTPAAFIATWSLSETPIALRRPILELLAGFDVFLLAYQEIFESIDNLKFFAEWKASLPGVEWQDFPNTLIPGNRYLFGTRKSRP